MTTQQALKLAQDSLTTRADALYREAGYERVNYEKSLCLQRITEYREAAHLIALLREPEPLKNHE